MGGQIKLFSAILLICLIFLSTASLVAAECDLEKTNKVDKDILCRDVTITINESTRIYPSYKLELVNVTLSFESDELKNIVNEGLVIINNSILKPGPGYNNSNFFFQNKAGSRFKLYNSKIVNFGRSHPRTEGFVIETEHSFIKNNYFIGNRDGSVAAIRLKRADSNIIKNNTFQGDFWPIIGLYSSDGNTISDNQFIASEGDLLEVSNSRRNIIKNNKFITSNGRMRGLRLDVSSYNNITDNVFNSCQPNSIAFNYLGGSNQNYQENNSVFLSGGFSTGIKLRRSTNENTFKSNLIWLKNHRSAAVEFLEHSTKNIFVDNDLISEDYFSVVNDQTENVYFEKNYYGETQISAIQEKIRDKFDESSLGAVSFVPYSKESFLQNTADEDLFKCCLEWNNCIGGSQQRVCYSSGVESIEKRDCEIMADVPITSDSVTKQLIEEEQAIPLANKERYSNNKSILKSLTRVKNNFKSKINNLWVIDYEIISNEELSRHHLTDGSISYGLSMKLNGDIYLYKTDLIEVNEIYKGEESFLNFIRFYLKARLGKNLIKNQGFDINEPSFPSDVLTIKGPFSTKSTFYFAHKNSSSIDWLRNETNQLISNIDWKKEDFSRPVCDEVLGLEKGIEIGMGVIEFNLNLNKIRKPVCYGKIEDLTCKDLGVKFSRACYQALDQDNLAIHLTHAFNTEYKTSKVNDKETNHFIFKRNIYELINNDLGLEAVDVSIPIEFPSFFPFDKGVSILCSLEVPVCEDRISYTINTSDIRFSIREEESSLKLKNIGKIGVARNHLLAGGVSGVVYAVECPNFMIEAGEECELKYDAVDKNDAINVRIKYLGQDIDACKEGIDAGCEPKPNKCPISSLVVCEPPNKLLKINYPSENQICDRYICEEESYGDCGNDNVCLRKQNNCELMDDLSLRDNCYLKKALEKEDIYYCSGIVNAEYRENCENNVNCAVHQPEVVHYVDPEDFTMKFRRSYIIELSTNYTKNLARNNAEVLTRKQLWSTERRDRVRSCQEVFLYEGDCRYMKSSNSTKRYVTDINGMMVIPSEDIDLEKEYSISLSSELPCMDQNWKPLRIHPEEQEIWE